LDESTAKFFTSRHTTLSRRGYGFDKPVLEVGEPGPTSDLASRSAFGHSGFTGTTVWADPKYDLIYVFLSNRIHPSASNRKLIRMDVRTRIQGVIYRAILQDL
jgi:CubicO group peptidase (beta-lactamase class C family)